jgi:hypothetical protein
MDKGEGGEGIQRAWPRDQVKILHAEIIKSLARGEGGRGGRLPLCKEKIFVLYKKEIFFLCKKQICFLYKKQICFLYKRQMEIDKTNKKQSEGRGGRGRGESSRDLR